MCPGLTLNTKDGEPDAGVSDLAGIREGETLKSWLRSKIQEKSDFKYSCP